MSPNTLLNVKENLKKASIINDNQIDELASHMKLWRKGQTVYPSKIKSLLLINYSEVYEVLELIKNMGILEYNYEMYCHKCEQFVDSYILSSLNEFPKDLYCNLGKHELNPFKDSILIFKVINIE